MTGFNAAFDADADQGVRRYEHEHEHEHEHLLKTEGPGGLLYR